uniref:Pentatricopeptide repeat-containing protein n=1 Tax=Cucumis sativus TaxID=3659 RepID=A0A0A0LF40_CUCSA
MDGLCRVGRSDEAMELLNEAEENGLKPSVVTFNTLFNGFTFIRALCRTSLKEKDVLEDAHQLGSVNETFCVLGLGIPFTAISFSACNELNTQGIYFSACNV